MALPKFKCPSCGKEYKRQIFFDNHLSTCQKYNFAKLNRDDEVDNSYLVKYVQELSRKYDHVVSELDKLRKYVEKTKRQINIPDWLDNKYLCQTNFKEWIKELSLSDDYLTVVFNNDLIAGFTKIISDYFDIEDENIPIRCFDQKKNTFYVFQDRWKVMTLKEFEFIVSSINSKIIYLLKEWQDEHRSLIEFNDDRYQRNVMKVLGGNMSQEFINSRVKNMLFNKLKFNLKEVVEFEFI